MWGDVGDTGRYGREALARLHRGEGVGLVALHRLARRAHLRALHLLERLALAGRHLRRLARRLRRLHLGLRQRRLALLRRIGLQGGPRRVAGRALLGEELGLPPLPLALRRRLRRQLLLLLLAQPLLLRRLQSLAHRRVSRHRLGVPDEVAQPAVDHDAAEAARGEGHAVPG